jgi:2-dehydro-3-deoxyphosphooctonate aldolase (KDO 8-P synthase)
MPGGQGKSSGGKREFVEPLARAAVAVGVAGLFIEAHENPAEAISDGPNQVPMSHLEALLTTLKRLDDMSKDLAYQQMPA